MKHRFLAAALAEFEEAIDWYDEKQPGVGQRFSQEVKRTVRRISLRPESYGRLTSNTRYCAVNRFPYAVLYQVDVDEIVIVAVMHTSRRPGYWHVRVAEP
jgi:plasmid stabilization system protein ParE